MVIGFLKILILIMLAHGVAGLLPFLDDWREKFISGDASAVLFLDKCIATRKSSLFTIILSVIAYVILSVIEGVLVSYAA